MHRLILLGAVVLLVLCPAGSAAEELTTFGRALFLDPNLSEPPGQSCATCHDPERAFSDASTNVKTDRVSDALSLGADGVSLIDRNTPTLTYAAMIPPFQKIDGFYSGGLFLDGRSATFTDQAREPMLNPREMGQPSPAAIAARVLENDRYRARLVEHFGRAVLEDGSRVLNAVGSAVASFERSAEFASFDSKYDRYLSGDYTMTREEALGRELFFSDLINCVQCHVNDPGKIAVRETFTNHRYHNIGVPVNLSARAANGLGANHKDLGLLENPVVSDSRHAGKFRVPTLRNVAVTAPYMHNGVFRDLETAVLFYGKYMLTNRPSQINPETGTRWRDAEVPETIDLEILRSGQPLDAKRAASIVAFLRTLTDQRYEHLLE